MRLFTSFGVAAQSRRCSVFIFVNITGGFGGFFASLLDWGTAGGPGKGMKVSAPDILRGGGGGILGCSGGGTKPGSSDPSPGKIDCA